MGYAKNPKLIKEVEKYLIEMVEAEDRLEWRSTDPSTLSYKLRQAISIAANYPLYQSYAALKAKYIIRISGGKVSAELRVPSFASIKQGMASITLPEGMDVMSIIGAALEHKASRMFFPAAEQDDLERLHEWSSRNGYNMVVSDAGITITKEDVGELAWQPST